MKNNFFKLMVIGAISSFLFLGCKKDNEEPNSNTEENGNEVNYLTFTDHRDDRVYKYLKIGNQYWMVENLKYKPDTGNVRLLNNDSLNLEKYGYLYDWELAKIVAPEGWHLPTDTEWQEMIDYMGGYTIAGGKMKVKDNYWNLPNTGADNYYNFNAKGGGFYNSNTTNFEDEGISVSYWTATPKYTNKVWYIELRYDNSEADKTYYEGGNYNGRYVRCVKDN